MLQTWGDISESMSYFCPGSTNTSTRARTHSPGFDGSTHFVNVCVCHQGQPSRHFYKWPFLVYHSCTTTQRCCRGKRAEAAFCPAPLEQLSPLSPMRYCLVVQRKSKQVLGCWDGNLQWSRINKSAPHLSVEWTKGHRRGNVQNRQPTTGAKSRAGLLLYICVLYIQRSTGESMSFLWPTTIISCEVFAVSEITA